VAEPAFLLFVIVERSPVLHRSRACRPTLGAYTGRWGGGREGQKIVRNGPRINEAEEGREGGKADIQQARYTRTSLSARVGVNDEVGVVDRLSQPNEDVEDVRVVVEDRPGLQVGVKLSLGLGVERLVEVLLTLVHRVVAELDKAGWEHDVLGPAIR